MNGTTDTTYYIHKDYLGSYDVITDEQRNVLERLSFDPWGRRRNPTDWTFNNVPASHLFDRGYTGHEHLDIFGLINMNGRVYDPWLGRFLSPDPFVQSPGYSQSYNRYSYCLNNPLKYTDPSGYTQININSIIELLLSSHYGGSWSQSGGLHFFSSDEEAIAVTTGINGPTGEWVYKIVSTKNRGEFKWKYPWRCKGDGTMSETPVYGWVLVESSSLSDPYIAEPNVDNSSDGDEWHAPMSLDDMETMANGGGVHDVSNAGLNFIAGYEGYSATTYNDVAGLATIGYGHLIKSVESFGILSRSAATQLLRKDASFAVNAVNKYVKVSLNQNQFDALTSLTFNIGAGGFSKSSVLRNVNSGNTLSIDKSFMMWNKATINGVLTPVQGLTNRRQAESNLFMNGDY